MLVVLLVVAKGGLEDAMVVGGEVLVVGELMRKDSVVVG